MIRYWTDEEITFVAGRYHLMTVRSIADAINRPAASVRMLASKLGVTDPSGRTQRRLAREEEEQSPIQYNPFITGKIARPISATSGYSRWHGAYA